MVVRLAPSVKTLRRLCLYHRNNRCRWRISNYILHISLGQLYFFLKFLHGFDWSPVVRSGSDCGVQLNFPLFDLSYRDNSYNQLASATFHLLVRPSCLRSLSTTQLTDVDIRWGNRAGWGVLDGVNRLVGCASCVVL